MSFLQLNAQAEVNTYGDIPNNRIAANGWAHFDWDGSGTRTTIDVTQLSIHKAIGTAAIAEIFKEILMYPNPTKGIVHISKIADYKLFDISGILLFEREADKMDLSKSKNGHYVVSLNGKHNKVIKD